MTGNYNRKFTLGTVVMLGLWLAPAALLTEAKGGPKGTPSDPVRIGMVRSMFRDIPPEMVQAMARPFRSLMENQTGLSGEVEHLPDAWALAEKLQRGETHLGVFHGFEFAWVKQRYPELEPLVIAVPPVRKLQGFLVVRADSAIHQLDDLDGKKVALPTGSREYSRLFLQRAIQSVVNIQQACPDCIENALHELIDGQLAAVVSDAAALKSFEDRHPGKFAKLRILAESEVFPSTVVVYRRQGLEPGILTRFYNGLIKAHTTTQGRTLMMLWKLKGFEGIPQGYAEQLAACLRSYPPPDSATGTGTLTSGGGKTTEATPANRVRD